MSNIITLDQTTRRIRELNDELRVNLNGGSWHISDGVAALPNSQFLETILAVQLFADFTPLNDPQGEHDWGEVIVGNQTVIWMISSHDLDTWDPSPDPTDPAVTRRILRLTLAEEYD